jgi:cobalamin synthase
MNKELLIPVGIIALSIAFLDPFMVLMPISIIYFLIALLLIAAFAYSLLIWQENPIDEREYMLRAYAGRMSFISGVGILVLGIVYQVLIVHEVDVFLIAALVGMTIVKYVSHKHAQNRF